MRNEIFQKLVKVVQLRDTTDECAIVRTILETMRDLPEGSIVYQDCFKISIEEILK